MLSLILKKLIDILSQIVDNYNKWLCIFDVFIVDLALAFASIIAPMFSLCFCYCSNIFIFYWSSFIIFIATVPIGGYIWLFSKSKA